MKRRPVAAASGDDDGEEKVVKDIVDDSMF